MKNSHKTSITIKVGEPQPLPCPRCGNYYGYQYRDLYRMGYNTCHNKNGEYEGGEYDDGVLLNKAVIVYCANCGRRLPFKLQRTDSEELIPSEDNR